jgi:hypothetical protein
MKHTILGFVPSNGLRSILALGCVALLPGCTTPHPSSHASSARVQTLDASLSALKAEFNRDASKPRLLALLSPTCDGCVYGARALQQEAEADAAVTAKLEVLVAWLPMLDTDSEREARNSALRFHFAGAHHFYDGNKQTSARLMAEQFPNAVREALEILPRDHPKRERLEAQRNLPPEEVPLWDTILVFPPGVQWGDRSPAPVCWSRQIGFNGEAKPGEKPSFFWKSGTRQLPAKSDWHLEVREAINAAVQTIAEREQR